jgi:hypothetical protein
VKVTQIHNFNFFLFCVSLSLSPFTLRDFLWAVRVSEREVTERLHNYGSNQQYEIYTQKKRG